MFFNVMEGSVTLGSQQEENIASIQQTETVKGLYQVEFDSVERCLLASQFFCCKTSSVKIKDPMFIMGCDIH